MTGLFVGFIDGTIVDGGDMKREVEVNVINDILYPYGAIMTNTTIVRIKTTLLLFNIFFGDIVLKDCNGWWCRCFVE